MRYSASRLPIFVDVMGIAMIAIVVFHIGGELAHRVGQFAPLLGAVIGGCLSFWSATLPHMRFPGDEWDNREKVSWICIGAGMLLWGVAKASGAITYHKGNLPSLRWLTLDIAVFQSWPLSASFYNHHEVQTNGALSSLLILS